MSKRARITEPINVAYCSDHGLHGSRRTCFVCGAECEQVAMVEAALRYRQRKAWTVGRLLLTTCSQAGNAPVVDGGSGCTDDGRDWGGYVVLRAPWRRDRWGQRPPGEAIVIGWIGAVCPRQPHTLLTTSNRPRLRRIGGLVR